MQQNVIHFTAFYSLYWDVFWIPYKALFTRAICQTEFPLLFNNGEQKQTVPVEIWHSCISKRILNIYVDLEITKYLEGCKVIQSFEGILLNILTLHRCWSLAR